MNNYKINRKDFVYYIGIILLSLLNWEYYSKLLEFPNIIKSFFTIISLVCFSYVILENKYSPRKLIRIFMIVFLFLLSSILSREYFLLLSALAVISAKNIEKNKIIKILLFINTAFIFFHILMYFAGIVINKKNYVTYLNGISRQTLNLRHPNYLAAVLFWNLASYTYISKNNKIIKIVVSLTVLIIMYILTYSRTTVFLFTLLIFIIVFEDFFKNKIKIVKIFTILIIFMQIILACNCNTQDIFRNKSLYSLNEILSQRLYLNIIAWGRYGITLFGQLLLNNYKETIIIDSFYISCCVQYGIINLCMILIAYMKLSNRNVKQILYATLTLLAGLTERYILFTSISFPMLFFSECILKDKEEKNDRKENSFFNG